MAKIISLKDISSIPGVHITMDSEKERSIIVHYNNMKYKFIECKCGIYYFDTTNNDNNNTSVTKYSLITTSK